MNKLWVALIIFIVVIAGAGAYFLLSSNYKPKMPEVKLPSEQTNVPKDQNTVTISNFTFDPGTITVKVGDTVTWVNEDGVVHLIKSNDFNSENLKNGDTFKFKFTKAGTYDYICGIHTYMKGKVVVE